MKNNIYFILTLSLFISLNCIMCSGGGGGGTGLSKEKQILEHIANGWIEFEKSNYDSAEHFFDEALQLDNELAEGAAGKAWSRLMMDKSSLDAIENLLLKAKSNPKILNDVMAGLAIVNNLQKKYSSSVDYVSQLLDASSSYVFSHKADIDYHDLLIIKAHSYFYSKNFDKAYETILEITTNYLFDPQNPETWEVNGDKYPSYEGAISAALAKLSEQYKSF